MTPTGRRSPAGPGRHSARAVDLVGAGAASARSGGSAPTLHEPVRHHLAGGGKRVRAALVLLSAAAVRGARGGAAIPGAVAIELVHNFSLLHDDIIDGDRERRHRPTVWAAFGIGTGHHRRRRPAALASRGPARGARPRAAWSRPPAPWPTATQQMIAGQADDMAFETAAVGDASRSASPWRQARPGPCWLRRLARRRPGRRRRREVVEALARLRRPPGLAFQAVDDLLGIWGDPADHRQAGRERPAPHKKSLPVAAALAAADGRRGRARGPPRPGELTASRRGPSHRA